MPSIIVIRRKRTNVRVPCFTITPRPHDTLGHVFDWPIEDDDPNDTITLTESGRQLAQEIIARRAQENGNA